MTKSLDPILVTALQWDSQKDSLESATGGFFYNCSVSEAYIAEASGHMFIYSSMKCLFYAL